MSMDYQLTGEWLTTLRATLVRTMVKKEWSLTLCVWLTYAVEASMHVIRHCYGLLYYETRISLFRMELNAVA